MLIFHVCHNDTVYCGNALASPGCADFFLHVQQYFGMLTFTAGYIVPAPGNGRASFNSTPGRSSSGGSMRISSGPNPGAYAVLTLPVRGTDIADATPRKLRESAFVEACLRWLT